MIKIGIVGITGYGGIELFRLLKKHPHADISILSSRSNKGTKINQIYPHLNGFDDLITESSPEEMAEECDCIFTATPHGGASIPYAQEAVKKDKKIIDLSADFRLKDKDIYETWYKCKHTDSDLLKNAVYGLPELHRNEIKNSSIIANPGCYTTGAILASAPVIDKSFIDKKSLIVDAKSGVSGAGRSLKQNTMYTEVDSGIRAYGIASHRHTPEIEQELTEVAGSDITITFTPHLTPMIRGILTVSYLNLKEKISNDEIREIYKDFYKNEPFVRVIDKEVDTKNVAGTNFIDIYTTIDERTNRLIIVSALDNLIKGAAGQAVQNFNILFGFNEKTALDFYALYP